MADTQQDPFSAFGGQMHDTNTAPLQDPFAAFGGQAHATTTTPATSAGSKIGGFATGLVDSVNPLPLVNTVEHSVREASKGAINSATQGDAFAFMDHGPKKVSAQLQTARDTASQQATAESVIPDLSAKSGVEALGGKVNEGAYTAGVATGAVATLGADLVADTSTVKAMSTLGKDKVLQPIVESLGSFFKSIENKATGSALGIDSSKAGKLTEAGRVTSAGKREQNIANKGGIEGMRKVADAAEAVGAIGADEHVMTFSGSAAKLERKVGILNDYANDVLNTHMADAWSEIKAKADAGEITAPSGAKYIEETKNAYIDYQHSKDMPVDEKVLSYIDTRLPQLGLKPGTFQSPETINKVAAQLYKGVGDDRVLSQITSNALRNANEHIVTAFVSPEKAQAIKTSSANVSNIASIRTGLKIKMAKAVPIAEQIADNGSSIAGAVTSLITKNPFATIAVEGGKGAYKFAQSVPGKTAAASTARFANDVLKYAPKLGVAGYQLMRLAATKGLVSAQERYAHLMLDDKDFRSKLNSIKNSDQSGAQ